MKHCAVIGGGPGGLLTAFFLEKKLGAKCQVTLFEAQNRLGGKIRTETFPSQSIPYEAGVAELYDYSTIGPDPLRDLVTRLGLTTVPMGGQAVVLRDQIIPSLTDLKSIAGESAYNAVCQFHRECQDTMPPQDYYEGCWQDDNGSHLSTQSFADYLRQRVSNEIALRYIKTSSHSDIATEPHLTNALNGIKNLLMDDPRYMRLYTLQGGIEQFPRALERNITGELLTNHPVTRIETTNNGRYQVFTGGSNGGKYREFDNVILALPDYWLRSIEFGDTALQLAMDRHCAYYDRPAHYLRITILFQEPFWRNEISGSYFMLDAFGGCCVYDESSRYEANGHGVLSWLLAGTDAVVCSNFQDDQLVQRVLDSLPSALQHGKRLMLESHVYRWLASINAQPGGFPEKDLVSRHMPAPDNQSNLFVVGDYLFDSTVNGVLDSADFVTDLVLAQLHRQNSLSSEVKLSTNTLAAIPPGNQSSLDGDYFRLYDGERTYQESFREYFDAAYTANLIEAAWGVKPPYKLLDVGSACGLTLADFEAVGIEAWGVENCPEIHAQTPARWQERNRLGDLRELEFEDNSFDFAYDTALCYVPEKDLERAIKELCRVTRTGVIFGSIAADMSSAVIEEHDIFFGVQSMKTLWQWSELFLAQGFRLAVINRKTLDKIWQIETEANEDDCQWYSNSESMRYCFYTKKIQSNQSVLGLCGD